MRRLLGGLRCRGLYNIKRNLGGCGLNSCGSGYVVHMWFPVNDDKPFGSVTEFLD